MKLVTQVTLIGGVLGLISSPGFLGFLMGAVTGFVLSVIYTIFFQD